MRIARTTDRAVIFVGVVLPKVFAALVRDPTLAAVAPLNILSPLRLTSHASDNTSSNASLICRSLNGLHRKACATFFDGFTAVSRKDSPESAGLSFCRLARRWLRNCDSKLV